MDAALARPHRDRGRIEIGGQEHFYLEGQAALALPQEGGDMVVHSSPSTRPRSSTRWPRRWACPMHAVRVEVRRMGGGFGGKESQGNALAVACAVAARAPGGPARCAMTATTTWSSPASATISASTTARASTPRAGSGRRFHVQYARCGWAQDLSLPVADRAMLHADNAYHLPHAGSSHRLKTNTQSATAFRGFGGPQGMVGIERVMDQIAHAGARPAGGAAAQLLRRPRARRGHRKR
jgi:xanthine dehydrogenase large subunit